MSKTIIINGSSRPMGDTYKACQKVVKISGAKYQDLGELVIMPYDYDYDNADDDFRGFIKHVVNNYDTIVFATPVYWYTMSGIMKNFIDRFSDLIRVMKDDGRKLREMKMKVLSVSHSDDCPEEFEMPFKRSANYLSMEYLGHSHFPVEKEEENDEKYRSFCKDL